MIQLLKYLVQYRISDMSELIRNSKKDPLPCSELLTGKTVVITGATSGIGLKTAHLIAEKGADLICINRNLQKSKQLEEDLKRIYKCSVSSIICDFTSLKQVELCADQLLKINKKIDVFIANAGVYYINKTFTKDNIEMVFQVNHLSSFFLIYKLKEKFIKDNCTRIIYVNSEGHRFSLGGVHVNDLNWEHHTYTGLKSYGASKTAQLLTMLKFNELFADSNVTINAMHPGNVRTNIGENNGEKYLRFKEKYILKSARDPEDSAKALYYLAAEPELENVSGYFFNFTEKEKPAPHAIDRTAVEPVWNKSLELCGL